MKCRKLTFSIAGFLVLTTAACSQQGVSKMSAPDSSSGVAAASASSSPLPTLQLEAEATSEQNYYANAVAKAVRAAQLSKGALSNDDWVLIAQLWQQSVDLLKQVPKTNPNYAQAQTNLKNYSQSLALAKTKTGRPTNLTIQSTPIPAAPGAQVKQPQPDAVIPKAPTAMSVSQFIEQVYFDEVINRGGSGNSLWCTTNEASQSALFAPRSYQVLNVHLAPNGSGGSVTARINSSNRGGQPIIANWVFAVTKGQTIGERDLKAQNSPVTAQQYRKGVGGWCMAMMFES